MPDPASLATTLRLGGLSSGELDAVARAIRDDATATAELEMEFTPAALGGPRFAVTIHSATPELHAEIHGALQLAARGWDTGVARILAEQADARTKGYTLAHDLAHQGGILLDAALYYLCAGNGWPFPGDAPSRADKERCLAKAGGLIASELDRLRAVREVGS